MSLGNDLVQQSGVGGRERGDVRVVILRDDEHVRRRLRVDIAKRQHPAGIQDARRGHRLGGDCTEQAFRHTKILEPGGYTRRRAAQLSRGARVWAPRAAG